MASAPKARLTGEPTALRPAGVLSTTEPTPEQYGAARSLVGAYRTHGHLAARLDPLGTDPPGDPALEPGLPRARPGEPSSACPAALRSVAVPGRDAGRGPAAPARELLRADRVPDRAPPLARQRRWLREAIESGALRRAPAGAEQQQLLIRLAARRGVRALPAAHFLGEKQFSIEGVDMMILMLDEVIAISAARPARARPCIGMAHRGRLNVLAHVLRRTYASILAEFEGRPGERDRGPICPRAAPAT